MSTLASLRTRILSMSEKSELTIFYVAFGIYVAYASIMFTMFGVHRAMFVIAGIDPLAIALRIVWALLGVKLLLQRYTLPQAFLVLLVVFTGVRAWQYSGHWTFIFDLLLFIAAGQGVKIRRLAQISLVITSVVFVVTVVSCFAGIIENVTIGSDFADDASGRNALGFLHPNTFGRFVFQIVLSALVLRYKKIDWKNAALIILGALVTWFVSESETFVAVIVLAGIIHVLSIKIHSQRLLAIVGLASTCTIIVFTLFALFAFDSNVSVWSQINSALSGRLALAHHYWSEYPVSLFGQTFDDAIIPWYPQANGNLLVDNAYAHIFFRYGVLTVFLIIVGTIAVFIKAVRESKWNVALFGLFLYVIVGFAENAFYMFDVNYFLITIAAVIYPQSFYRDQSLEPEPIETTKENNENP